MQKQKLFLFLLLVMLSKLPAIGQQELPLPELVTKNGSTQLFVDGRPFLILGGETGNATASDPAAMRPYWLNLQQLHLNTVLAPVYWELMEPTEGKFNFALVDSLLVNARLHQLKLVLLWFGTWKNSMSCYVPGWVKKDAARFVRTQDKNHRSQEIISVFNKDILDADIKAFTALMAHLRDADRQHTVIMVQVENEIGMLPTAREISVAADKYFNAAVPGELMQWLQKNKAQLQPPLLEKWQQNGFATKGSWTTVFGDGLATDEIFQAWHYARFANAVSAAGKRVYRLPMYVNAALNRPNVLPGDYPSAGPLPHLMDVWKAAAPDIDMLSPDFYNPDTKYWCDLYTRKDNPLFVPEMRLNTSCAAKVFFIVGHYSAIGFSPFSIEDAAGPTAAALQKSYETLEQLQQLVPVSKRQQMEGVLLDKDNRTQTLLMGDYTLKVSHDNTLGWTAAARDSIWEMAGATIIQTAKDEFFVAGTGVAITVSGNATDKVANIYRVDEIRYQNGVEVMGRRMNGDQDHQGRHIRIPGGVWGIQKFTMYQSPAAVDK